MQTHADPRTLRNSGTLLMGSLEVPKKFLIKQKFKLNLVFLITCFSILEREEICTKATKAKNQNLSVILQFCCFEGRSGT